MKMKHLATLIEIVLTTSSFAAGIELRPDVSPRGTLQFGFRCQYDDRDENINFLWLIRTSQTLGRRMPPLWWSAYDTSTHRYYLPWMPYVAPPQLQPETGTFLLSSKDERVVHPVLARLKNTEIHFSVQGSEASVIYTFPLGLYRANAVEYFYDMTHPIQHCDVNEFDLPFHP
jgi:hypothetical protein